jgi:hypothetical protein
MSYVQYAPPLIDLGYTPVCLIPRSQVPGICNRGYWIARDGWSTLPHLDPVKEIDLCRNGGIGLLTGVRSKDVIKVDIDVDVSEPVGAALVAALPTTAIRFIGRRGIGLLFTCPGAKTRPYKISGRMIVEVLADGKQCVLPPSTHPKTGKPYRWVGEKTLLEETPPYIDYDELIRIIEEVLSRFGRHKEPARPEPQAGRGAASDDPWRDINNIALTRLPAWVPALGLYKCRPVNSGFEAVTTWRPSSTGRPIGHRGAKLKIHPTGIYDFGVSKGYSAIDLVMAALGLSASEAFSWLDEKLGWSVGCPEIEIAPAGPQEAPEKPAGEAKAEEPKAEQEKANDPGEPPAFIRDLLEGAWMDGDTEPEVPPWAVKKLIPRTSLGLFPGQSGKGKTAVGINYAVCTMEGLPFAGRKTLVTGGVFFLALEDAEAVPAKLLAAKVQNGIDRKKRLPFYTTQKFPKLLGGNKRADPAAVKKLKALVEYADRQLRKRHGQPLVMFLVDSLMRLAGFSDEDSSAEGQQIIDVLYGLSRELGIVIAAIDHQGKNPAAGARGTSVKRDGPDWMISVYGTDNPTEGQVVFTKVRSAPDSEVVKFYKEAIVLSRDSDGEENTALAIRWGEAGGPNPADAKPEKGHTRPQRNLIKALGEAMKNSPLRTPGGLPCTRLGAVRMAFYRIHVEEEKGADPSQARRKALKRAIDDLQETGEVELLQPSDEDTKPDDNNTLIWMPIRT